MSILIDKNTTVIVQGGTGKQGSFHTRLMREYGTNIVGIVKPGVSASTNEFPIYPSVAEATLHTKVDASVIFTPPSSAKDALAEAVFSGVKLAVVITENVPVHDSMVMRKIARDHGTLMIGPNTIGLISPGKSKVGVMPAELYKAGKIGIISRSGTLTHEVSSIISESGLGITTAIDMGGDMVIGSGFAELSRMLDSDPETKAIVVIGEVGGNKEQDLAEYLSSKIIKKPLIAYIAGINAPSGKRMGHAGAIVSGGSTTADAKLKILASSGAIVARYLDEIPDLIDKSLS
ncbi:MAG: succinate--CoA ligase subunit alpha [Conexivisphaerales archaeon]